MQCYGGLTEHTVFGPSAIKSDHEIEFKMFTLTSGSFFRFHDVRILPTLDTSSHHLGRDQTLYMRRVLLPTAWGPLEDFKKPQTPPTVI